jgi:hypothetical protein
MRFIPKKSFFVAASLLFSLGAFAAAQEMAAVVSEDKPPEVERSEESATTTGQTNGAGFRFTYPVRDASTDRIYTEANPPAEPDIPTLAESAAAAGTAGNEAAAVDADEFFAETPAPPLEEFPGGENLPEGEDIGEGRFSKSPFRFSFAVYEGYNSNVNGAANNGVESLYTMVNAGVSYAFGTSRLKMDLGLSAGVTFYYNNEGLQNNGIFPTGAFTIGANYAATPRLDLSLVSSTTLLSQPNFGISGGSSNYQGNYLVSATTLGAEYLWLPKLATETSYSPVVYYYIEPEGDNFSYLDQTIAQQFIFLWKPSTSLVAEYRFNLRNYFELTDYNSLGNYALLGFDHTFNPRSTMNFRAGAEQRISQNPVTGGTYNYIGPFGQLGFDYALGRRTKVGLVSRYGTTGTTVNNFSQDVQFLIGLQASHAIGRRLSLGAFANYQNNSYSQPGGEVDGVDLTPSFNYNVFNAGLSAGYYLRPDIWSLQAGYAFTTVVSSNTDFQGDYTQNVVFLGTQLDF